MPTAETNHLSITREQWDADPTDLVVVVEGEHASDYIDRTNVVNPPPFLVAATQPCKTCRGFGELFLYHAAAPWYRAETSRVSCPDCHEGHPVIEVRAECPTCEAIPFCVGCQSKHAGKMRCPRCGTQPPEHGTVLLGRVTVTAVVPIPYVDGRFAVRCKKVPT